MNNKSFSIIKSFLLIVLLTFSTNVLSDESALLSQQALECGLTNNNIVHPASGEVCAEDVSFRIFYKLFPDVFDNIIFNLVDVGTLEEVKELEQRNLETNRRYQYALIYSIYALVELSFFLLGFFILFYALMGLLKTMESGTAFGEDWGVTNMVKKYGLIAVLLIPLGNGFVLGQMFIFILIMFAIYLANFLWGAYLSFMEVGNNPIDVVAYAEKERSEEENKLDFITRVAEQGDHVSKNAQYMTSKMIDISLCKNRTERRLIDHNSSEIRRHGVEKFAECVAKDTSTAELRGLRATGGLNVVDDDSFFSYNMYPLDIEAGSPETKADMVLGFVTGPIMGGDSSTKLVKGNEVIFGSNSQFGNKCDDFKFNINYQCGKAISEPVEIKNSSLQNLQKQVNFQSNYEAISSQFSSEINVGNVYDIVSAGWDNIYEDALDYYTDSFERKMSHEDEDRIRVLSYIYHQLIYYDLLMGNMNAWVDDYVSGGNTSLNLVPHASSFALSERIEFSKGMVDDIMHYHCSKHQDIRTKANRMKNSIESSGQVSGDASSVCLSIDSNGAMSVYGEELDDSDPDFQSELELVEANMRDSISISYNFLTDELIGVMASVEFSFFNSLQPLTTNSLIHSLRRDGWFMLGGYMFKLSQEKEVEHKYLKALRNSFEISSNFHGKAFVANLTGPFTPRGLSALGERGTFKDVSIDKRRLVPARDEGFSPNMRTSAFVNSYATDRLQGVENRSDVNPLSRLYKYVMNPFSDFKTAVGMSRNESFTIENLKECYEDEEVECPIPLENPLIGLSNFGKQLIEISTSVMILSISMSRMSDAYLHFSSSGSSGEMSSGTGSLGGMGGIANNVLTKLVDVGELVVTLLVSFTGFMFIVGVIFAYVLPLIPFIAFTVAAISWIIFCIQVLFLFPLWCVFSMRLASQQDTNTDMYKATYNLIMQILLKPSVIVGVYVLLWSILSVMIGILNLTIVPYLLSLIDTDTFLLVGLIVSLFVLLLYSVLLYSIIRMAFKTLHTLVKKIFGYLKVDVSNDVSGQQTPDDMLQNAMTGGIIAGYLQNSGQQLKQNAQQSRRGRKSAGQDNEAPRDAQRMIDEKNRENNQKGEE